MEKELCFKVEKTELYLEQVLVDYMDIPIFFLCKGGRWYYAALCTDIEELKYVIVKVPSFEVYSLLHGRNPMRELFLNQKEYWEVLSGEDISEDIVKKHAIESLDVSILPEKNACFEILTEEIQSYVQRFDNEFLDMTYFEQSREIEYFDNAMINILSNIQDHDVERYLNVGDYKKCANN